MADVGSLWFSVLYKDDPKQLDQIKERALKKLQEMKLVTKVSGTVNKKELIDSIASTLSGQQFKIGVVVDKADATKAVRDALTKAGITTDFSAGELRAAKARAAQTKANSYANSQMALARQRAASAAKAELGLAAARERSANAAKAHVSASLRMNSAMTSQISISGQLANQMLGLYSIYTAERFIRNLVEIGGEFEKQELALSAMLNDAGKASEIFGQIKNLAVISPFGVRELNDYTKRMKAFSIPYNELFDTTKRLADISAGVGVDMGRIILAYGQVRSAAFLRGQELRQFTEAGIPMVDALADKFSKLENRVISAGEVIDMITKKKVSFEDVKDVLWGMTGEGGQFYNMQEVLSESLSAKWKNLGDGIDIMMADIAKSSSGTLKGIAELLTGLTSNWEALVPAIYAAVTAFGFYKVISFASSRVMGNEYAMTVKSILTKKQQEAAVLRVASAYRTLSASEKLAIRTSGQMTRADYEQMAASGMLTRDKLLHLVATKKLTIAQAKRIALSAGMNAIDAQQIKNFTLLRIGAMHFRNALASISIALKSLMINPYVIAFAALSALFEGIRHFGFAPFGIEGEKSKEMKERIEELSKTAQEGYKNLKKDLEKFNGIDIGAASGDSFVTAIKEIKEVLKDYSPSVNNILKEADGIESLSDKYVFLRNALTDTAEAYKILNEISNVSEFAIDATDGLVNESVTENIQDYVNAMAKVSKNIAGLGKYKIEIEDAIKKAVEGDVGLAQSISGKNLEEQLKILLSYPEVLAKISSQLHTQSYPASALFGKVVKSHQDAASVLNNDVLPDLKDYAANVKDQLAMKGWDLSNLTKSQEESLRLATKTIYNGVTGLTPEIQRMIDTQVLTVEYKIEPVIADYTEENIYGILAEKIDKFQKELSLKPGGMVDNAPIEMFTGKELLSMTSDEKVVEALDDKVKESAEALKIAQRIKGNTDGIRKAQAIHEFYKAVREKFLNGGDNDDSGKGYGKKDPELELLNERFKQIKEFISMYEKLIDTYGKADALVRTSQSGLFAADLFKGSSVESIYEDARKEIEKIIESIDGSTKERRAFTDGARSYNIVELVPKLDKEALQKAISEMEKYISDTTKKWDIYNQLISAGASKKDASTYAFGVLSNYDTESQYLIDTVQKKLNEKGVDIPFNLSEEDAEKILGGKESPLYKQLFKVWKDAKGAIEKDTLSIALDDAKVLAKSRSTLEKIRILSEKYASKTGLDIGENGELFGDTSGMSSVQKAYFDEYSDALSDLKGELLELLPIWDEIFGDHTYKSYGQIQEAADVANQIIKNAEVIRNKDGKPVRYKSSYIDKDGNTQDVGGSIAKLTQLREAIRKLYNEGREKNPFATLVKNLKDIFSKKGDEEDDKSTEEKLAAIGESAAASAAIVGDFAGKMSEMFDALGNESMAEAMNTVQDVMGSISNIGEGFAKGNIVGGVAAIAGEIVGWIGKIAQAHDRKLNKAIERSQERVEHLKNVYSQIEAMLEKTLGSGANVKLIDAENDKTRLNQLNAQIESIRKKGKLDIVDLVNLSKSTTEASKLEKRVDAYNKGGAYGYQRALLQEQFSEVNSQLANEQKKKKKNKGKIEDYKNQIAELKQEIKDFAEETADSLYGINLKDWASQLGDSLYEAWKRGEDGAEAFKKKVSEIMGQVMNSVWKLGVLEPAMKNLQTMLFGNDGMGGMFGSDFELDGKEVEQIADYLMGLSEKSDSFNEAMDMLDEYMKKKYGVSMKEESASSGLSKGIAGVTENTANLLASYINAIRADVAAKLVLVRQLIEDFYPQMNMIAQAQLTELKTISKNTTDSVALVTEIRDMLGAARIDKSRGFYLK